AWCTEPFIGIVVVAVGMMCGKLRKRGTILHNTPPPVGALPAALRGNEAVEGVNLEIEQIEVLLAVDVVLADGGGLARRHRIVEMNAVGTASLLVLGRVHAALARCRPTDARGSKIRDLRATRCVGLGYCRQGEQKSDDKQRDTQNEGRCVRHEIARSD